MLETSNVFPFDVPRGVHEFPRERHALSEHGLSTVVADLHDIDYVIARASSKSCPGCVRGDGGSLPTTVEDSKTRFSRRHRRRRQLPSGMWKPSWCRLKFRMAGRVKKFRQLYPPPPRSPPPPAIRCLEFLHSSLSRCSLPRVKCSDASNRRARDLFMVAVLVAVG